MCGRYSLFLTEELFEWFGIDQGEEPLEDHYNIAPGQTNPVIIQDGSDRKLAMMRWGLVPHWAKDPKIGYKMINARAETVDEKPSFKKSFETRRCLVPASGFYEWKREGKEKQPYFIHLTKSPFFAMAGLFDEWTNPEGKTLQTYTIITTDANTTMAAIHDRMPAILDRNDEKTWLNPKTDVDELLSMIHPYPAVFTDMYPVSKVVNAAKTDDKELIRPMNSK